jgi:2-iminobutanoate/2-iminopropanoate deaminase
MIKSIITDKAPMPIGPYSQAIVFGNHVWISGCIALNPANGEMIQNSIEEETKAVMSNLQSIVEASGSSMSKILKTTIFLTDMNQFGQVNSIYGQYLVSPFPARETVQVSALPKGANVEISCVACL